MKISLLKYTALLLTLCVFAGCQPKDRFAVHEDGTVTDSQSRLIWQQKDDGIKRTWLEVWPACFDVLTQSLFIASGLLGLGFSYPSNKTKQNAGKRPNRRQAWFSRKSNVN